MYKIYFAVLIFLIYVNASGEQIPPLCAGGVNQLLTLVDRPSIAYSPCTVPKQLILIESGYNYAQVIPRNNAHIVPQTEIRIGIMNNSEIDIFPPQYIYQFPIKASGFTSSSIGLKHVAYYDEHQLITLQGYITPSSGSDYYGTRSTGFLINAIYNYGFDSGVSISTLAGLLSSADSPNQDNQRFYSFNPIVVLGWSLSDKLAPYIELYGQSKTASNEGWGLSMDTGFNYLVAKNLTVDMEYGQSISGGISGIKRYIGAGFVLLIG